MTLHMFRMFKKIRQPTDNQQLIWRVLTVLILLLGLGVRLFDLTDPPLDSAPTAQLLSAIVARGMYYQMMPDADPALREAAIQMMNSLEVYEPRILAGLAAVTYLLIGHEEVWVARIYSSVFWVFGGLILYWLANKLVSRRGAIVTLGYFLLLPFAIIASRTFQTSALMVMLTILAVYAFYRWSEGRNWKWAMAAGLLAGLTVLVKVTAAFPVIGVAVAVVLGQYRLGQALKSKQVWLMVLLMAIPPAIYYFFMIPDRSYNYFTFSAVSEWARLLDPSHYVRWISVLHRLVDLSILFIAIGSTLIATPKMRNLLVGWWIGFFAYGLFFPYHILTHEYYNLPIMPVIALALAPIAELGLARLGQQGFIWRAAAAIAILACIAYPAWVGRSTLYAVSYRHEPGVWLKIGEAVPPDDKVIALTHDYGYRLMYYGWRQVNQLWPWGVDLAVSAAHGGSTDFEMMFTERTSGMRYFLVTSEGELNNQPLLRDRLYNNYALIDSGDSYLLFDLELPISEDGTP